MVSQKQKIEAPITISVTSEQRLDASVQANIQPAATKVADMVIGASTFVCLATQMSIYLSQKAFPCLWQIYLSFPVICLHFLRSRNNKEVCSNSRIISFNSLSRSLDSWRIALLSFLVSFCSAS